MHRWLALTLWAGSLQAQQTSLVPSLIEYLDLSGAQITRLRQNATEYNRFYVEKAARYAQVSRELVEENAREVLDPLGLGQRYVEQEAICRELRTAYDQNYEKNLTVMTVAQKAKLSALDTVATNAGLAYSAASNNLIEGSGGLGFTLGQDFAGFLLGIPGLSSIPNLGTPGGLCGLPPVSSNPVLINRTKEAK